MAKADTGKPKPSGKKKPSAENEKPQSERFIETARALGADETGKAFDAAFASIVPPRSKSS